MKSYLRIKSNSELEILWWLDKANSNAAQMKYNRITKMLIEVLQRKDFFQ